MSFSPDQISILCVYSALAVYAIAFIAYSIDLAKRGVAAGAAANAADEVDADATAAPVAVGMLQAAASAQVAAARAGAASASPYGPTGEASDAAAPRRSRWRSALEAGASVEYGRSPALRVAVAMTVLAWALHLTADVLRGVAAGRVPWANMYEFALTGTLVVTTVYLVVLLFAKQDLRFLGTFVTGLVLVLLGVAAVNFYVEVAPLPPALQSVWLVIHVFVATSSVGFFALGFALSAVQLMQARRESLVASAEAITKSFLATLPNSVSLENLAYRVNIIGFILWTFTLMAGAIWAEKAWGRYWGWDTKEVWTFIIWVIYAGYIHARATRGWRGSRSAWLAIIGFSAVLFNFTIVNLFFKGLHAYSGL
ncbi:c-type cytochrome biogenesis protein CcsB [Agromyces intestinalis]|uniref:C-type cytochrome biogenesis protein CcsB n=1 Tax=Agromyces intestinalis TaxID=2592652 RepID=A0A5C1YGC3_9MICO|nr:c-type cytochrome biogenesis protein CcsB [Agromyces intestinalis]QEO14139.1 c-type cytochrome biogenesis protein CcsB [Agromyces intestinalis]